MHAATAALIVLAILPQGSGAQRPDTTTRSLCFRGEPTPRCRAFFITELGFYRPLATSKTTFSYGVPGDPDQPTAQEDDFRGQLTWELGAMMNHGPRMAYGGTLVLGIPSANGAEVGVKGRVRRWLSPNGTAVDLGAGIIKGEGTMPALGPRTTTGITADVALNASDYGALVLRYDRLSTGGRTSSALSGGARLGSRPALIGTGVLALGVAILLAAYISGGGID